VRARRHRFGGAEVLTLGRPRPYEWRSTACRLVVLVLLGGCGSSPARVEAGDTAIKLALLHGVHEIRATKDRRELRAELARVIASLRRDRPSTAADRRARTVAVLGFEATRKGLRYQLAFYENDSGNLPAATRDAGLADRYLKLGANRLRAAGRIVRVHVGTLNGY
jgi:hypothetical protein